MTSAPNASDRSIGSSPAEERYAPRQLHVAVTRSVKRGQEAAFEGAIESFFRQAENGTATRAYLLKPVGSGSREYGILRSFPSEQAKRDFYQSQVFKQWEAEVAGMVEGEASRREVQDLDIHGLEAFFDASVVRPADARKGPPTWKMALITWLAVNPAVYLSATGFGAVAGKQPMLVELLSVNALVVAVLTWAFMPALTKLFSGWLTPKESP